MRKNRDQKRSGASAVVVLLLVSGCSTGGLTTHHSMQMHADLPEWLRSSEYSIAVVVDDSLDEEKPDPSRDVGAIYVKAFNTIDGVDAWNAKVPESDDQGSDIVKLCRKLKVYEGADAVLVCDARWNRYLAIPLWLVPHSGIYGHFTYELRDAQSGEVLFKSKDSWKAKSKAGLKYMANEQLNRDLLGITLASKLRSLRALALVPREETGLQVVAKH